MQININAFLNCTSLEEMHFEKLSSSVSTNMYECGVPDTCKIIVHDSVYNDFYDIEFPENKRKLIQYSEYLKENIRKFQNSHIILSIIYLKLIIEENVNVFLNNKLNQLIDFLFKKYKFDSKVKTEIILTTNKLKNIKI